MTKHTGPWPITPARLQAIRARCERTPGTPEGRALLDLLEEVARLQALLAEYQAALPPNPLTASERLSLIGAARGETRAKTGERRGVSYDTVRSQMSSVRRRLKATSTAHAVAIACINGWVTRRDIDVPKESR